MKKRWLVLMVVVGPLLALGVAAGISSAASHAAGSTILYVTPDGGGSCTGWWDNACTLQTALSTTATYGDEIWVAMGIHTPTAETVCTATFQLKSGVALYGGFAGGESIRNARNWQANVTVLSGDIDNNDSTDINGVLTTTANIGGSNSYHVVTSSGVTETAVLDGFTITGGAADGTSPDDKGGGMYNYDDGSPKLINLTFSGNRAYQGGGMCNDDSTPTLTNVTFSGNSAEGGLYPGGGGMYNYYSSPTLTNVTITNNSASAGTQPAGGGMYNDHSSPTLVNVIFSGNSASGASGGGGMKNYSYSSPTLVNVIFSGNSAFVGGGMDNHFYSSPTLVNVTFSRNHAELEGGGMRNYRWCSPTATNCIFWGNTAGCSTAMCGHQIYAALSSFPAVSYSVVQDGCSHLPVGSCQHITTANPQFVDSDGPDNIAGTLDDDLRLQVTSPVIDAGHNDAVPADTLDLDGDADTTEKLPFDLDGYRRIRGGTVDMGAYEWPVSLTLTKTVTIDHGGTATILDFQGYLDDTPVPWGVPQPVVSGTHTVSETALAGYEAFPWGDGCSPDGTITVAIDEDAACSVVNDDIAPTVTLTKTVVNDDGGTATVLDFQAYLDGQPVPWGVPQPVVSGTHTVSETLLFAYSSGSWGGDCDQQGNVTLSTGQSALCSITNDDWPRWSFPLMLKDYGP
ncbi:MAG: hypothetical protein GTO49_04360 [Anaerolineae bacterium]|nr:hypothetical protein [Anaerolineae bacterium]